MVFVGDIKFNFCHRYFVRDTYTATVASGDKVTKESDIKRKNLSDKDGFPSGKYHFMPGNAP